MGNSRIAAAAQKLGVALVITLLAGHALARDDKAMHSVSSALESNVAQDVITGEIQLFFGDGNHPPIARKHGNYQSNKKSNGVGRSDEAVCERAFLSALKSLQDRAVREGGNAVVNIVSFYKRNRVSSQTEFECGSGAIMSGVTLKGDVVTLK